MTAPNNRERILPRLIDDEIKESFINYSMSVIVSRALPDVRDGLKPVHRRVLYAMNELGLVPGRPYKKSATVVGDVLGKYHPHGDSSVYDALVRMVQEFSLRYPLIDGQGNFGSVEGDPAAAYRYTEARLTPIAMEMLADIDKNTVDFVPNFDDRLQEPAVLPSGIPNLVVNGSSGIAVGMATNIPPHNLGEVVSALLHLIDHPEATIAELRRYVKGPDFPTAGFIYGRQGVKDYQETGRGRIVMRARAVIEEKESSNKAQIVVTEIPYQVNSAKLLEDIADLVRDKKLEGISDLRNESDREGLRIVIELKRDAIPRVVLNQLYKHTQLQATFGVIMLALVPDAATGRLVPKIMPLKDVLEHYVDAPARGDRAACAVRARQGGGARAHPRRAQDRRRQHRRGDQGHPRRRGHADGERPAADAVQAQRAAGRSDSQHAPGQAHRAGDREAGGGAEGGPGHDQGTARAARVASPGAWRR